MLNIGTIKLVQMSDFMFPILNHRNNSDENEKSYIDRS